MSNLSIEERLQRMEDIHQIQNLMGKMVYTHAAGIHEDYTKNWAQKTPGVTMEMADWGVWEGLDGIERQGKYHAIGSIKRAGKLSLLPISTPVIEVAGDGKTAKGLWIAGGPESGRFGPDGKIQAYWAYAKYGIDFVKEDGKWKIWHQQVYSVFFTPYDRSWVETYEHPIFKVPEEYQPNRPPTYSWHYSTEAETENVPVPPEPYETWDGKSMTTANMEE